MRNISFALTLEAFNNGTKSVTRRIGWKDAKVGDRYMGVEKAQGIKRGQLVRLGVIEVVSVRRERLDAITSEDVGREGFPGITPADFVDMFCAHMGCLPGHEVTRIEFHRIGICDGCGQETAITIGAAGHARIDHAPSCDGHCVGTCPWKYECGPVIPLKNHERKDP